VNMGRRSEGSSSTDCLLASVAMGPNRRPFLKWWNYFAAYESRLGDLARRSRDGMLQRPIRLLEIGIWKGGFLDVWRDYFGPQAVIFGVDIDPGVKDLEITSAQVRVGSQADRGFLESVVAEMGGVDIVVDDGSHRCEDVLTSLEVLFPHLENGGLYCIEDLHTSYWPAWGGGLRRKGSSVEVLKQLIDGLHQPYFERPANSNQLGIGHGNLASIQFFDSMVILTKGDQRQPMPFHGGADLHA